MSDARFAELCRHTRETALLESIGELLQWDERTYLPPAAGAYRAEQITYLTGMVHRRRTDPRLGDWLGELEASPLAADPHSDTGTTIRELRREYDKQVKLPQQLVEELARTAVLGQQVWVEARKKNDFAMFQPLVEKTVRLKREQADAIGFPECRYDALLDDYEPGARTSRVAAVLQALRQQLVTLVAAIQESGRRPPLELLRHPFPVDRQEAFGREAAAALGFDFQRGRLDITHHPFCTGLGPDDTRITTRYDERFFPSSFYGILHEAGHGIYDQGLRTEQFGLPPGRYLSLGIHESQSRLWENLVGRSRGFWEYFLPSARKHGPPALAAATVDEVFFAVNDVRPSLIRVEADEATYNLHIAIRFELEQALVEDQLPVADLPAAWNDRYREYLGIEPEQDSQGVLQDIHWSAGLLGYFPTYSLGNLYASQFFERAEQDLGPLDPAFRQGQFAPLLDWLRRHIHEPGQRYTADELIQRVTGRPLDHRPLLTYLTNKYTTLYQLS